MSPLIATSAVPAFGTLKTIAMLIFFAAFLGILIWLIFSRSKKFREAARLPLEDDDPPAPKADRS